MVTVSKMCVCVCVNNILKLYKQLFSLQSNGDIKYNLPTSLLVSSTSALAEEFY